MNYEDINNLIERFLNGTATEAEESQLVDFFRNADQVPAEWEAVKMLLDSLDTDAYDLTADELATLTEVPAPVPMRRTPRRWMAVAAAAALLLAVGASLLYYNVREEKAVASLQDNKNNCTDVQDPASYAPAPTEHPLATQGFTIPVPPQGATLRRGAKMATLHQNMPSTENITLENNEDDSPSKLEGEPPAAAGAYDNANMAYSVTEHPEPELQMVVYSETDLPVINPQNLLYTEEDIRKLQALQRQALIAEAQQAIEITKYNLKQVEILLAQK